MAQIRERIGKDKIDKNGKLIKGKITYQVCIRVKGSEPIYETFERKTDAELWAKGVEYQLKRGFSIKDNEAKKHTLGELIDRYIKEVLSRRKNDQQKIKTQLLWWKSHIGCRLLSEITPSLIAKYRDILLTESVKSKTGYRSASTARKYMCSLSLALKKGINEWEWLDVNPLNKVEGIKVDNARERYLNEDEQLRLLDAALNSSNKYIYLLVVLALATGARRGELMNLTWDNVKLDLEEPMLYLMKTKNGENRAVPITGLALEVMKEFSKIRQINSKLVFPHADGKKPMDLRWYWEQVVKNAKIEDFTFHDTRHCAGSNLAMNGASLLDIADILGHKTMQMVKRYSHLTKKHTAKVLKSMNDKQFAKHIEKTKNQI